MNNKELTNACIRAINTGIEHPTIVLRIPGKHTKKSQYKLARGKSPIGDIVEWNDDSIIVLFDAIDVLAWITAKDGIA